MKILLAVDGSKYSLDAVDCLIDHADWYRESPEVELLTVHLPIPKLPGFSLAVGKSQVQRYYQEEGEARLAPAKKKLDAAGIKYTARSSTRARIRSARTSRSMTLRRPRWGCRSQYR